MSGSIRSSNVSARSSRNPHRWLTSPWMETTTVTIRLQSALPPGELLKVVYESLDASGISQVYAKVEQRYTELTGTSGTLQEEARTPSE